MKRMRRLAASAVMAGVLASGMLIGTARIQAAEKKGGDGQGATCAYLLNVINYPYVSPYIKVWAISLYNSMGCQPAIP